MKDDKAKSALGLLQTFIVRGLNNMTRILKSEYIEFLQQFDLLKNFVTFLFGVASQQSASPDELLVSSLLLELKADYIREHAMTQRKRSLGASEKSGGTVSSSENGLQFILKRSDAPEDMFYFKTKIQFGPNEGTHFEGPVLEKYAEGQEGGIYLVASERLAELSKATLEILQHAKFVLTDSGLNVDAFLESLKAEISKDRAYRACAETCFKVCENTDDVRKIQSIIAAGSTVKNTDPTDRGHFLGMILKHIGQDIWEKVEKATYIKQYANIGMEHSFDEVSTVWSTQALAELIEQKWSQEESFMVQIAMGETFEKIRSGEFLLLEASKEESKDTADASATDEAKKDDESKQEETKAEEGKDEEKKDEEKKETDKIPDFISILTQTERLSNEVAESFYSESAPDKPTTSTFSDNFRHAVFTGELGESEIADNYRTTVKTLKQNYGRQILLNILSSSVDELDDASKEFIR